MGDRKDQLQRDAHGMDQCDPCTQQVGDDKITELEERPVVRELQGVGLGGA